MGCEAKIEGSMMRIMTLADLDEVHGIELAVQAYPWTRGNFMDALKHGYSSCVAEDSGVIHGYAILMPGLDEAELLTIGVAAASQRIGLGRMLLNEMLQKASAMNMKRVFLEVRTSNVAAISLYRNAGFSLVGVRRGYYQNAGGSEDALVMACDLKDEANGQA